MRCENEFGFYEELFGYVADVAETEDFIESLRMPRLYQAGEIMRSEKKNVNLWVPLLEVHPSWKRGAQGIGDCVSWGAELAMTMLLAIQAKQGISEWITEAATEPIYGGGRVEANGGRLGGYSDGSYGAAAAKWLENWGTLLRLDYSQETGISEHNLSRYSKSKAKEWGNYGCGGKEDAGRDDGKLDTIARKYPCRQVTLVKTVDELAAAIMNGYPVTVASNIGYGRMKRNGDGVCRISGNWAHQMMFGGIRWVNGKPQFRLFQSWGKSCSGPDPGIDNEVISHCSWWITASDAARMLRANDSWAFSNLEGFPPQKLDWAETASNFDWRTNNAFRTNVFSTSA